MITPKKAGDALRKYLKAVSPEQFRADMYRYSPELRENLAEERVANDFDASGNEMKLNAYIASALTQLSEEDRARIYKMSGLVAGICGELAIEAYEPRLISDPIAHPQFHKDAVFMTDRKRIAESDLLILLCDHPSFGGGQELDLAFNSLTPVVLISNIQTTVSRMVLGDPSLKEHIIYTDLEDLEQQLRQYLPKLRPVLEEHKRVAQSNRAGGEVALSIGENVKRRRKALGLSVQQVVERSKLITERMLEQIENEPLQVSNPSIVQLKHLADVLNTSVDELLREDQIPS